MTAVAQLTDPRTVSRRMRVLCVDDHAFLLDGLLTRLGKEPDIECVGTLRGADGLLAEVGRLQPDVVLLDVEMPGRDAFEAAEEVQRTYPTTRVVFLSAFVRDSYLESAFNAGAWGYFAKCDEASEVVEGIRRVHRGEFAASASVAERCAPAGRHPHVSRQALGLGGEVPAARIALLSPREREVLRLIGQGLARHEIARALFRSPKTIDAHQEKIMQKLNIHRRTDLVRFAIREGLAEA
ncbi:MAG: response regulator transcription factor [Phycisphaerales bacterium]|nr:response regulator transcription factor [Phycisphaerales bacterium]